MALTMEMISSGSFVSRATGQASTLPNCLNRTALPSMTGMAADGPMSPSPRPRSVGDDGDGVLLDSEHPGTLGVVVDALQTRPLRGV